jgi:tripartite ATP-independent transporter DctP family solute receptor
MKKTLAALALALLVVLPGAAVRAETIRLQAGHTLAPDHPYHLGLLYLAELLNERTGGDVVLEVYPNSMLGGEQELIVALQMGQVDVTAISTAPLSGFTSDFLVFDLPFIFPDTRTARRVVDGPIGRRILKSVESIDLIGVTFFENGFRQITNSARPIVDPEDLKGLKIRTMQNKIHEAAFEVLGAEPVPLAFGELYSALEKKTVDGQENPVPIIYTSKFYKVQAYCSLTGHIYSPTPVFIGKAAWDKLDERQRGVFLAAAEEARGYQRSLIDQQNSDYVDRLKKLDMNVSEVDKAVWRRAMEPVYRRFKAQIGPEAIDEIQKAIDGSR